MHYSNDKVGKAVRKRSFYLGVYALPLGAGAALAALVFFLYKTGRLPGNDAYIGYFVAAGLYSFLHGVQKKKWLKMPEGDYHYIAAHPQRSGINLNEPDAYLAEYSFAPRNMVFSLAIGLLLIAANIWMATRGNGILYLVFGLGFGLYMVYLGIRGALDKTPKLKVAATGLWTAKLGFVQWDDLHLAEVVGEKSGDSQQLLLKIWKIGTPFETANQPDEVLVLTGLKARESIEYCINDSIRAYNAGKGG